MDDPKPDKADAAPAADQGEETTALRRTPSQSRSRERVERMLACASDIIAEKGSDAMRMSEVAAKAGVSIGSLYQYFPDKSAILRTLAERYNQGCRHCIAEELAAADSMDALCAAFVALFDEYYAMFVAEPVIRDIRSGTLADKTLSDMEIAESRFNGAVLAEAVRRVRPGSGGPELDSLAFFIMHLGEATMRLAISVEPDEGKDLVEAFKRMALNELRRA